MTLRELAQKILDLPPADQDLPVFIEKEWNDVREPHLYKSYDGSEYTL